MKQRYLLLFFLFVSQTILFSQSVIISQADSLYRLEKWPPAASLYQKALAKGEGHPMWTNFRLGVCQQKLTKHKDAIASYRKALAAGTMSYAMFNMGLAFAATGQYPSDQPHIFSIPTPP